MRDGEECGERKSVWGNFQREKQRSRKRDFFTFSSPKKQKPKEMLPTKDREKKRHRQRHDFFAR
jgi:hypothetical protein